MLRRQFLSTLAAAPLLEARSNKIDRTRLSIIADEVSKTSMNDVYAFLEKFGLKNLELRDVPGEPLLTSAFTVRWSEARFPSAMRSGRPPRMPVPEES